MYLTTVVVVNHRGRMTIAEQIGGLRRTLYRLLSRRLADKTDRSLRELQLLRAVAKGETPTQAEVADRLLIDPPAVSRLVAKLCEEGLLIQREGKNRRCVCLTVTRKAAREVALLDEGIDWLNAMVKKQVGASETKLLTALLGQVQAGLRTLE